MKLIPLTQGQFAKVDDKDFPRLNSEKWYAHWSKFTKSFYARRNIPSLKEGQRQTSVAMHREVLGVPGGVFVDHANHDTLDNQKSNISVVTRAANALNRKGANVGNRSGIRGVSWNKKCGKWAVEISVVGKRKYLGVFATVESASAAYAASGGSR